MHTSASKIAVAASLAAFAWPAIAPAQVAQDIFWVHPGNGSFTQPTNWNPPQVPGAGDAAHFDLDLNYVVSFNQDITTQQLRVHDGRPIFELGGNTYSVTGSAEDEFSVIVGTTPADYARLILLNGTLESHRSLIGRDAGSNGVVRVESGQGAWSPGVWNTTEDLVIGRSGRGELHVLDGGIVRSHRGIVAEEAGSQGHVVVRGDGSLWSLPQGPQVQLHSLIIGDRGHATVEIAEGGRVGQRIIANITIARESGSVGTVKVTGVGSRLEADRLIIGSGGEGTLNVLEGALAEPEILHIGMTGGGTGIVNVVGPGSTLRVSTPDSDLHLAGGSIINALDGGDVSSEDISAGPGSQINIAGSGSRLWTLGMFLAGQMDVSDGGRASGGFDIDDGGRLTVRGSGTILDLNRFQSSGGPRVRNGAVLEVIEGGEVRWGDADNMIVEGGGMVVVRDPGSRLHSIVNLRVGSDNGMAHVSLSAGASARIVGLGVGTVSGGSGLFEVSGDGTHLEIWSPAPIGRLELDPSDTGWGILRVVAGATLNATANMTVRHRGRVELEGQYASIRVLELLGGDVLLAAGGGKLLEVGPPFSTGQPLEIDTATGSRIDLADNEMIVHGGDLPEIHDWVKEGYAGGSWNGPGIASSVAAEDSQYALGVGPEGDGVRVRFTFGGDANLDRQVGIADLGILAANWQQSNRFWQHGDFNYDGEVNIADLGILASNWGKGMSDVSNHVSFEEALAMFDAFNGVVVPEPAWAGLGLIGLLGLRRRARG